MLNWLLFPFEALRQDIERVRAALDSTVATLDPLEPLRRDTEGTARRLPLPAPNPGPAKVEENLLTHTEHEILRLAAEGLTNREIAERLGIAEGTVRVHFKDIRRRIGVATRVEAVSAFGQPTLRERVSWAALRVPRVTAAPYERRAAELLNMVDVIERRPSTERLSRLESQLVDLADEAMGAMRITSGPEEERLSMLRARLLAATRDVAPVRASLEAMGRETLPLRIEMARRGFISALRVLRENLSGEFNRTPLVVERF